MVPARYAPSAPGKPQVQLRLRRQRLRLEIDGKVITGVSVPVSASYGFADATGEVKLKIAAHDATR